MPPMWNWYVGPESYGRFIERVFAARGRDWRVLPSAANGQPALAAYTAEDGRHVLHTLQVFTVEAGRIVRTTVFQDPAVFALFELPATVD
jgi:RNA polymerase sigma-70 factor (ECF subfamily)